jgi:hypothetical protein
MRSLPSNKHLLSKENFPQFVTETSNLELEYVGNVLPKVSLATTEREVNKTFHSGKII